MRGYGLRSVVVQDAAIKARRANSMELTEDGVVYLSDALTEEDADTVANHAAVHAVKQRGSAAYGDFLDNTGGKLDFHSTRAKEVIDLVTDSRFEGQDFMDLTPDQQRTVFDELNAVVWGCYKADAENARAQFKGVFNDFDGYIQALGGVMEAEKTEAQASRRFRYEDSVKSAVKRKWGETGYGYIEKMMSDLQNGHKPTRTWAKAMNRLRSNYAGAVLTLNASVAMKQAASYPTAAAVLGWGPLAKAMGNVGKVDLDLIAKYTPLQWYTKFSPHCTKNRNHKIDTITIHHMAGNLSAETCGNVFQTRQASTNYGVDGKGRVGQYVDESDRAWATANPANDNRAVNIEVANNGGAPDWPVSDAAYAKLIELVADICRRNGIEKLVWGGNKADRVYHRNGCNMTVHQDFMATSCPGPYLLRHMPEIAERVNQLLGAEPAPADPAPADPEKTGGSVQVGDVVEFTGSAHYTSAGGNTSFPCKPGKARVTRIAAGAKHPYHLIHLPGSGTVYGWVDAENVR